MNVENIQQTQLKERFKWASIAILFLTAVVLNLVFVKISLAIRLIAWILLLCLATLMAYHTRAGLTAWHFVQTAQGELKRVVWPTRKETIQTTIAIVIMACVVALFLWGVDSVLLWAVSLLTGQKG